MAFVEVAGNPVPEGAKVHWLERTGRPRVRVMIAPALGQPRGTAIVAPGRTEFIEKWFEVIRELQGRGFCVFSIDWRGQGLSEREVGDPLKGHFRSFDDAVDDLAEALRLAADQLPRPHVLLAHSMGGGITLRALQRKQLEVVAAAFSSPMWGIARVGGAEKGFARVSRAFGAGKAFVPGVQKRWSREAFRGNNVTNDEARHQRTQDLIEAEPRFALAGPTLGWVAAAADIFAGFRKPGALAHLTFPILVVSAGDEKLVDNAAQSEVCARLPDCTHITVDGAMHEILMEKDEVRAKFWAAFDEMVDKAAPRAG